MKQIIIFLLAAMLSFSANAQRAPRLTEQQISNVVRHCECVMNSDVCILETRPDAVTTTQLLGGYGEVQPIDWNYLVKAGPSMCKEAANELHKDTWSARSFVATKSWRANFGPCLYTPKIIGKSQ